MFDASLIVDDPSATRKRVLEGSALAYRAMVLAALGLLKTQDPDARSDPETVFSDFERQFIDTRLFFERYIGNSEWAYFQAAHETGGVARDRDEARRRVEEAQLFIEASHACYTRLRQVQGGGSPAVTGALASTT